MKIRREIPASRYDPLLSEWAFQEHLITSFPAECLQITKTWCRSGSNSVHSIQKWPCWHFTWHGHDKWNSTFINENFMQFSFNGIQHSCQKILGVSIKTEILQTLKNIVILLKTIPNFSIIIFCPFLHQTEVSKTEMVIAHMETRISTDFVVHLLNEPLQYFCLLNLLQSIY